MGIKTHKPIDLAFFQGISSITYIDNFRGAILKPLSRVKPLVYFHPEGAFSHFNFFSASQFSSQDTKKGSRQNLPYLSENQLQSCFLLG